MAEILARLLLLCILLNVQVKVLLLASVLYIVFNLCTADPCGRAYYGVCLRLVNCCDSRIESRRGHGPLSLVSAVCCEVEASATGRSLVQRSHTECVCQWVIRQNKHLHLK